MGFAAVGLAFLMVLSLIRRSSARKWQMVGMVTLFAFVTVPLSVATLQDRFGGSSFTSDETARMTLEASARRMAKENLLGVGANNFVTANNVGGYLAKIGTPLTEATRKQPSHHAYLLARAETGWGGQLALIFLLVGVATAGIITAFRYRTIPLAGIALGSASACTALAFHSQFEYAFHTTTVQHLFFLNMAMVAGVAATSMRTRAHQRPAKKADKMRKRQAQIRSA